LLGDYDEAANDALLKLKFKLTQKAANDELIDVDQDGSSQVAKSTDKTQLNKGQDLMVRKSLMLNLKALKGYNQTGSYTSGSVKDSRASAKALPLLRGEVRHYMENERRKEEKEREVVSSQIVAKTLLV
jgi:hypothetical protein